MQDRNSRGWTLLHVAAAGGYVDIVRWLPELGANSYAKSRASLIGVPAELLDQVCTPA